MRRDVQAGGVCVAFGLGTVAVAWQYPMGTLLQVGPGLYPMVMGTLLTLVGGLITVFGAVGPADDAPEAADAPDWRGWASIVGGVALFILLVRPAGVLVATFATVVTAALGDRQNRLRAALSLGAGVAVLGALVFVIWLGMDLPILPAIFTR